MTVMSITEAKDSLLIGEDDWSSIKETLYLSSIPNMKESIVEGLNTSLDDCRENLEW